MLAGYPHDEASKRSAGVVVRAVQANSSQRTRKDEERGVVRIAAAGDLHAREGMEEQLRDSFRDLQGKADLALLAGDLTTHGEPREAAILAEACRGLDLPVIAVLGNHDWHLDRADEVAGALTDAGVTVLDRASTVIEAAGHQVGLVGTKGFVGGFPGSHLPDFGEPALRMVYAEATAEVKAIARGLQEISTCDLRIVLLHYAPTEQTLAGEPEGIWAFLGTDRMAAPIREHEPDLVLHGHAHVGSLEGSIGTVPVYNVSVPLMGRDFWIFELSGLREAAPPVH
jgi:Icc-related predicted phosphoesterase